MRGLSASHMTETAEAAGKYAGFGVIASVIAGAVFLVGFMSTMGGRGNGAVMILMLVMVAMITWVLLVWPLTVKRFFGERQFATMIDDRAPSSQLSPDRGLPALGWLLLAFGVFALATGLAAVLLGDFGDERALRRMSRGGNPMGQMMGLLGSAGGKSAWLGISVAVVQIWAGVELIRMTARYRLAGMVFGVLACVVAAYVHLPTLGQLMKGGFAMVSNPLAGMAYASVAMALVVPVATLVFVQRKVRDPRALAQTFE
jgi:MFS family permease